MHSLFPSFIRIAIPIFYFAILPHMDHNLWLESILFFPMMLENSAISVKTHGKCQEVSYLGHQQSRKTKQIDSACPNGRDGQ